MNPLIDWIEEQIKEGKTSPNKIATKTGFSKAMYYNVMSENADVSYNFCLGVSRALGEPLERILRIAQLLPPPRNSRLQEVADLCRDLPEEEIDMLISFIRWRRNERRIM